MLMKTFALAGVLVGLTALTAPTGAATEESSVGVTFNKDVLPILQKNCQSCHRPGEIAPMSFLTYRDARPWARAMKTAVVSRQMPPWFVEKTVGVQRFRDDPSLSDEEIAKIAAWVDGGAPRGNPADMPPPKQWGDGQVWTIGTPDLVVSSPTVTVKALAPDFQSDFKPTAVPLTEDRYIKAVEVREIRVQERAAPEVASSGEKARAALSYSLIHHAIVTARTQLGGDDDLPVDTGGPNFNIAHEAGQNATFYPDGLGVLLPAGSSLTWELHTHAFGKEADVRLDVAFKLHPKGYRPKYVFGGLGGGSFANHDLDIPAGQDSVRFEALSYVSKPVKLVTFEPHMHAGGKRMCLLASYPNGARQTINCAG